MSLLFESEPCSRCGGSGHYSYCPSYGTTCFRCKGLKETLTKRGAVAQGWFNQMCMKRIDQLQPGDKFRDIMITGGGTIGSALFTVIAVRPDESHYESLVNGVMVSGRRDLLAIEANGCTFLGKAPEDRILVRLPKEARAKVADLALSYQSLLSKTGKEPKWLKSIAW